jgi:hypothetical protein
MALLTECIDIIILITNIENISLPIEFWTYGH